MESNGNVIGSPRGKFEGVDALTLKLTAMALMLTDHIGIYLQLQGNSQSAGILRVVGRLAFPIFCFLLVEGYFHTSNVKKYLARLAIFAVISEIPFDLLLYRTPMYWGYQNVYVTLFLGLLLVWGYDSCLKKRQVFPATFIAAGLVAAAYFARCDYGSEGVLMIFLIYYFRQKPFLRILACGVVMMMIGGIEIYGIFAMLLVALYNGKKGWTPEDPKGRKVFQLAFYAFYPVHLLVLGLLNVLG